jgi:hypothetical protein
MEQSAADAESGAVVAGVLPNRRNPVWQDDAGREE